jgi:hypothetical protein
VTFPAITSSDGGHRYRCGSLLILLTPCGGFRAAVVAIHNGILAAVAGDADDLDGKHNRPPPVIDPVVLSIDLPTPVWQRIAAQARARAMSDQHYVRSMIDELAATLPVAVDDG